MQTISTYLKRVAGYLLISVLTGSLAFAATLPANSAISTTDNVVTLDMFTREDCQHCQDQKAWLKEILPTRADINVVYHELAEPAERAKFDEITEKAGLSKSTPVTFISGQIVQGFDDGATSGKYILDTIELAKKKPLVILSDYLSGKAAAVVSKGGAVCDEEGCTLPSSAYLVNVPFFGAVNVREYSLPVMSSILGFIDGFNPCAMWVLVTFLIALVQIGDKRKMWLVAGLFILAETIMYYLILNVWFTTWDFIGLDKWVTPLVGLLAIGSGIFFLYEGITSDGTCKVTSADQRKKIHFRIKEIVEKPFTIAIALGVIALALSVNIIEFACSIGIPQAFTKILQLNQLPWYSEQGLMAIYILFYMLDDFIVFGLALWSFEHIHMTTKYSKITNIIGGLLMLLLGALLIFYPEALKFI